MQLLAGLQPKTVGNLQTALPRRDWDFTLWECKLVPNKLEVLQASDMLILRPKRSKVFEKFREVYESEKRRVKDSISAAQQIRQGKILIVCAYQLPCARSTRSNHFDHLR